MWPLVMGATHPQGTLQSFVFVAVGPRTHTQFHGKPNAVGLTASWGRPGSILPLNGENVSKGVRAASTQIEARREESFTTRVDRTNDALFRSGWVCK